MAPASRTPRVAHSAALPAALRTAPAPGQAQEHAGEPEDLAQPIGEIAAVRGIDGRGIVDEDRQLGRAPSGLRRVEDAHGAATRTGWGVFADGGLHGPVERGGLEDLVE